MSFVNFLLIEIIRVIQEESLCLLLSERVSSQANNILNDLSFFFITFGETYPREAKKLPFDLMSHIQKGEKASSNIN